MKFLKISAILAIALSTQAQDSLPIYNGSVET